MNRNRQKENKTIVETLKFLEKGRYHDKKQYLEDFHNNGVELNGYTFKKDVWCFLVWKSTDIEDNPEFKGEPLLKIIPRFTEWDKMEDVLNAQSWTYL